MVSFRLTTSLVALSFFFQATTAAPLNSTHLALDKRAATKCADGGAAPCACNGALGLRKKSLNCPGTTYDFISKTDPKDGKMHKLTSSLGLNTQCDHLVELQYIADKMSAGICTHMTNAANKADFTTFFNTINTVPNLANVESSVNNAKGVAFGGKCFSATNAKAANGVSSYLTLIKSDAKSAANTIKSAMDTIMGAGNGFAATFATDYETLLTSLSTKCAADAKKLADAPVAQPGGGIQIIDETDKTINSCKRSWWMEARDLVVRAVTGKKSTKSASCTLPKKTGTTSKTGATTAKKGSAAAKKTTGKTTSAKKTTAKKAAVKKTTAKAKKNRRSD